MQSVCQSVYIYRILLVTSRLQIKNLFKKQLKHLHRCHYVTHYCPTGTFPLPTNIPSSHKKTATGLNPMAVVSCYCSLELSSRRSLLIEGCLGLRNDAVESIDVVHGEVCKNLAVYLDIGGLEAFNET